VAGPPILLQGSKLCSPQCEHMALTLEQWSRAYIAYIIGTVVTEPRLNQLTRVSWLSTAITGIDVIQTRRRSLGTITL
jgi:hypothetical protein